jgi:hypothetical protein
MKDTNNIKSEPISVLIADIMREAIEQAKPEMIKAMKMELIKQSPNIINLVLNNIVQ